MDEFDNLPNGQEAEDYYGGVQRQAALDARELTGKWVTKTDGTRVWHVRMED